MCGEEPRTGWFHWEPGQKEKLAKQYADGVSVNDLARMYKRKPSNIRTVLHNMGACVRQKRINRRNEARIMRLVDKGLTDSQISRKTKFCRSTVQRVRLASGNRKYKDSDMGVDGWPVGLSDDAYVVLKLLEEHDKGVSIPWIAGTIEKSQKTVAATLGRLMERKHVRQRGELRNAVYLLTARVKNMRRNFALTKKS